MNKDLAYYLNISYRIILVPSAEGGYAAEIPDLPGCISQGDTIEEALAMIEDAKVCWLESALEDNIKIPEPIPADEYSGKFNVRIPKSLHKALAEKAKEEEVSLNQYITYQLAQGIGYQIREKRKSKYKA